MDNQLESALETVKHIKKSNFIGLAHECDVSNNAEVNEVILEICKTSNIEILINNAGIAHVGNIENCKEEDLDRLYNVNIKGVYNCSKAVIPIMKKNKNIHQRTTLPLELHFQLCTKPSMPTRQTITATKNMHVPLPNSEKLKNTTFENSE